jgi:hypothetical protein
MRMRHVVICGLPGPSVLTHYLTNGTIFENTSLNIKCVFWFSLQLLSETYLILRRTERDMITHVYCSISIKLEFSRQIFEKYTSIKFHENPSSGSRVVACGQIDKTELIAAFRNFRTRLKTAFATECSLTNPVANQFAEWYAIAHLLHDDFFLPWRNRPSGRRPPH